MIQILFFSPKRLKSYLRFFLGLRQRIPPLSLLVLLYFLRRFLSFDPSWSSGVIFGIRVNRDDCFYIRRFGTCHIFCLCRSCCCRCGFVCTCTCRCAWFIFSFFAIKATGFRQKFCKSNLAVSFPLVSFRELTHSNSLKHEEISEKTNLSIVKILGGNRTTVCLQRWKFFHWNRCIRQRLKILIFFRTCLRCRLM